jgi:general stress protein YciG
MPGTIEGGLKTQETNKKRYGADYYRNIGKLGGLKSRGGGFASDKVGEDGLTGPERARLAGSKGGKLSKRNKGE